jgi:corin
LFAVALAPSLKSLRLQPSDSAHPVRYNGEGYVVFNEKGTVGKICTDNLNNSLPDAEVQSVLQSTAQSLCNLLTFE